MIDLSNLGIHEAHDLLQNGEVTCRELVTFYLDRIKKLDGEIKSILTLCEESSLEIADKVDAKIASGQEIGLLEGIPYTAKDMFLTKGTRTTAASKILGNFIPPYTATAISHLNKSGAILLAKVNQDEFAHGGSTENSAFQKTTNPLNKDFVPGGSSGGSAAAVAADFGIFSLGTDTGGSIRQPAAYCGVTGLKPSYGLVSRYGVIAMASSFDCVGPIARSARDTEIVLHAIAGVDANDSTTVSYQQLTGKRSLELKNIRIGLDSNFVNHTSILEAKKTFETSGHKISSIELPDGDLSLAAYYVLVPSEISSNLERYDGIRYGQVSDKAKDLMDTYSMTRDEFMGMEVKRRILTGTYALSAGYYNAYYKKAMQVRTVVIDKFNEIFKNCDVVITPTTVGPAFRAGDKADPIEMYKTDILTVSVNLAGLPAVSIPAGVDAGTGLPLSLQIIGKLGDDNKVIALAKEFQSLTNWHKLDSNEVKS